MRKVLSVLLVIVGFLLLLGTAGSADAELLSNGALVGRILLSLGTLIAGYIGFRCCEAREVAEYYRWMRRYHRT